MARRLFVGISAFLVGLIGLVGVFWTPALWALVVVGPLVLVGVHDMLQRSHSLLRNYPLIGHGRYLMEAVRPEIQQYFVESNTDGMPFSREARSAIYQRSKGASDKVPFGTQRDVYATGYEWVNHSMAPAQTLHDEPRVLIGGPDCSQPYLASRLNISAMSFGSLSKTAILALNGGAMSGGFAHNTGEGGISPHHLHHGGDLIWQLGTGYFGCRTEDGQFDPARFAEQAARPSVKMVEIKLSQGAKPAHGGILPASKVTPEIAAIRGVPMGHDVLSPSSHPAFDSPRGLLRFVEQLRELSGGKPIGFKLCVGIRAEVLALCKAMVDTNITPDFITVDGGEGGTGAAPLEFQGSVGTPLHDGLATIHGALVAAGLRDRIRLIASGKVANGFDIFRAMALGADLCASARAMMFSLGCIQARRCHENDCPVGVATQDPSLYQGLDPNLKSTRVANFHAGTMKSFLHLLAASGLEDPSEIRPWHISRRVSSTEVMHLGELFPTPQPGALLEGAADEATQLAWSEASPDSFRPGVDSPGPPAPGPHRLPTRRIRAVGV